MRVDRRVFLGAMLAAPLAAAGVRPVADNCSRWIMAWDLGSGPSYSLVIIRKANEEIIRACGVPVSYVGDGSSERVVRFRPVLEERAPEL